MEHEHEDNVQAILEALGIDTSDANFAGTPARWLKYLQSYTREYDPNKDLDITFPLKKQTAGDVYDRAMIVQAGIPFRAVCAHHLLPVLGTAHVGYIPGNRVVGLSKLSRLVYGISHASPSLQEDVCDAVTDAIMGRIDAAGAMCLISAEHGCMAARGVEEATGCIQTVTSSCKGIFQQNGKARMEFYHLIESGT
jgi:GTP cyclohydrolase I